MIVNNRWRGRMPFRECGENQALLKLYETQRRTGEPSPSLYWETIKTCWDNNDKYNESGRGKAGGSFTEQMRSALRAWMRTNHTIQLTFDYKLSRRQVVTVVGRLLCLRHDKRWGNGVRGFVLELLVASINGVVPEPRERITEFAWNRIIGRERLLSLESGLDKPLIV